MEDTSDLSGCSFTIQVSGKPYYLRAEDRSTCKDWVINLNRVREARMQVGGIKLVDTQFNHRRHSSQRKESGDECVGRVVVKANRTRTSRLTDDEEWRTLYRLEKEEERRLQEQLATAGVDEESLIAGDHSVASTGGRHTAESIMSANFVSLHALAKWEKKVTNFQQMRLRLIRWAHKIRMIRCVAREHDVLHHSSGGREEVPPEGMSSFDTNVGHTDDSHTLGDSEFSQSHNDPRNYMEDMSSYPGWIGKETQIHLSQGSAPPAGNRARNETVDIRTGHIVSAHEDGDKDERTIS